MNLTVIAIELTRDARNAAYRVGRCIGCTDPRRIGCINPHSPGRPRCEPCHRIWATTPPPDAIPADVLYSHQLCTGPVCCRDGKANRFRVRHDTGLCEMCTGLRRDKEGQP